MYPRYCSNRRKLSAITCAMMRERAAASSLTRCPTVTRKPALARSVGSSDGDVLTSWATPQLLDVPFVSEFSSFNVSATFLQHAELTCRPQMCLRGIEKRRQSVRETIVIGASSTTGPFERAVAQAFGRSWPRARRSLLQDSPLPTGRSHGRYRSRQGPAPPLRGAGHSL